MDLTRPGLTLEDALHLTPKFWAVHKDSIIVRDTTAHILVTIQLNLVAGTVAGFAVKRPDLQPLMKEILDFDISWVLLFGDFYNTADTI